MDLSRLKAIHEQRAQAVQQKVSKTEARLSQLELQETIVKVVKSLVDFLDGHTSKTVVINQLQDFATSQDSQKVVSALDSLHETLKTHKNTDISPLTEVMNKVLREVKSLPKDKLKLPEQKFVDYSEAIADLSIAIKAVEEAVKSQETTVKAPDVNVKAPVVKVDAPNLKPLEKAFKTAISGIKIPENQPTDIKPIVDEQKKQTKLLKEIRDTPSGGGFGGGGGSWVAVNEAGIPQPVQLDNGAVKIITAALALRKFASGTDIYIAESAPGVSQSDPYWRIQKIDSGANIYWKSGTGNFIHTAIDLTDVMTGTFV